MSDLMIHDWHKFVLGFSPEFVTSQLKGDERLVLDPFNGMGTTTTQCTLQGIRSIGFEANPAALVVAEAKLAGLQHACPWFRSNRLRVLNEFKSSDNQLPKIAIRNSIILENWQSCEGLGQSILRLNQPYQNLFMTALFEIAVQEASRLIFKPEPTVSLRKKTCSPDQILPLWQKQIDLMGAEIGDPISNLGILYKVDSCDSAYFPAYLQKYDQQIDRVITSPPYPNEKDYTRVTRLQLMLLGIHSDHALRVIKKNLMRSNSKAIWKGELFGSPISHLEPITRLAEKIHQEAKGKTDGFSRLYGCVISAYFGQLYAHLHMLKKYLAIGCQLTYMVGDQSYLGIPIPTGDLLALIAKDIGYTHVELEKYRDRSAGKQGSQIEWLVHFRN